VLWNTSIYRRAIPEIVLSAAFGEKVDISRTPLGVEPSIYQFTGRSELRVDCNKRFSAIVVLSPYRLNHAWLEVWRKLHAKKQKGEEIKPSDESDLLHQVESEGIMGYSYDGTLRTVVLENPYARNPFVLVWARRWMSAPAPKLKRYGLLRLVRDVLGVSGFLQINEDGEITSIVLNRSSAVARNFITAFQATLTDEGVAVELSGT
jgi:hypothetical protein